jgi:C-terminal processing protease CtpA/Prc
MCMCECSVDGVVVSDFKLKDLALRLLGTKGTAVKLDLLRGESREPYSTTIVRDSVKVG